LATSNAVVVEALLAHGADVHAKDNDGCGRRPVAILGDGRRVPRRAVAARYRRSVVLRATQHTHRHSTHTVALIHTHTRTHARTHARTHTDPHMHTHTHTQINTPTLTFTLDA